MKVDFKVMARVVAVMGLVGVLATAVTMDNAANVPTEVENVTNSTETVAEENFEVTIEEVEDAEVVTVSGETTEVATEVTTEVETTPETEAVAPVTEEPEVQTPVVEETEAVAEDTTPVVEETEIAQEPVLSPEELAWENSLTANVGDSLNVRAEANTDAAIVGSLYKGSKADIIENGAEWTKIKSGNVEGYVKNEYCVYGQEALVLTKEVCDVMATSVTDGLRIREEMSTEASILKVLDEGDAIKVDTTAETDGTWVAVVSNSKTCYVSAEYVNVELKTVKALTVEEQEEIRRAEEEAKRKAEEAKKAQQAKTATRVQGEAVSASVDEVTLLAAIIQCEAGGEKYEGQVAVGAVVMNRVKSSKFPNTIEGVIYQKGQFSPVKSGVLAKRLSGTIKQSCYDAAREALAGVDNTGGALYFRMKNLGRTGLEIGCHVFYK